MQDTFLLIYYTVFLCIKLMKGKTSQETQSADLNLYVPSIKNIVCVRRSRIF